MSDASVLYAVQDRIATVTLNRPAVMNAVNTAMRRELLSALGHGAKEARVIILAGSGNGFCAGQDLGDVDLDRPEELARILDEEYTPILKAIYECPVPVIAAVNGAAVGAGANIALACDIVIAAQSAVFVQAFARIGLMPDAGGTYWLPRQIGFARAMGAALLAEPVSARQAESWGMIWQAVADDRLAEVVAARAQQLADGPSLAIGLIKRALRASYGNGLDDQLALEAQLQGRALHSDDFREGAMAFLAKRKPRFKA